MVTPSNAPHIVCKMSPAGQLASVTWLNRLVAWQSRDKREGGTYRREGGAEGVREGGSEGRREGGSEGGG